MNRHGLLPQQFPGLWPHGQFEGLTLSETCTCPVIGQAHVRSYTAQIGKILLPKVIAAFLPFDGWRTRDTFNCNYRCVHCFYFYCCTMINYLPFTTHKGAEVAFPNIGVRGQFMPWSLRNLGYIKLPGIQESFAGPENSPVNVPASLEAGTFAK